MRVLASGDALAMVARQKFNEGVAGLVSGELQSAEDALRTALKTNQSSIQPVALYNLGHVRFEQGRELLKPHKDVFGSALGQPSDGFRALTDQTKELLDDGKQAAESAKAVLKNSSDIQEFIAAYQRAQAARRNLRPARDEVRRLTDLGESAKTRWDRSLGDFDSAFELERKNTDAEFNADVVRQHLDRLIKRLEELEQQQQQIAQMRDGLKEQMKGLRGKIPKEMQREDENAEGEDDDEEEDGQQPPPGGMQRQDIGKEREISTEMAKSLLERMKTETKSVPAGDQPEKPRDRKGRDW